MNKSLAGWNDEQKKLPIQHKKQQVFVVLLQRFLVYKSFDVNAN